MASSAAKIIISGTGRAGTTFLMQLLTELGEDTGYTAASWPRDYDHHCAAGLERDIAAVDAPRIVKNPALCETLPDLLARGEVVVEHAIIPVRSLAEAARSRMRIGGAGDTPGGLWGTSDAAEQQAVLAENFHRLVHTLVHYEVPITFLDFPRFVRDRCYAWSKLRPLLSDVDAETFRLAFERVARPELIHDFSRGLSADAGQPGREYERRKRGAQAKRYRRRALRWSTIALVLAVLVAWAW